MSKLNCNVQYNGMFSPFYSVHVFTDGNYVSGFLNYAYGDFLIAIGFALSFVEGIVLFEHF